MHQCENAKTSQDCRSILDSLLHPRGRSLHFDRLGRNHLDSLMTVGHDQICREISGELEDMARWFSGGKLSPEQFRLGITRLEQRKLQRFGLRLTSSVSPDHVVHFTLRFDDTDELCACMDVDPMTGKLAMQTTS